MKTKLTGYEYKAKRIFVPFPFPSELLNRVKFTFLFNLN